ncbi:MAG: dihydrolipoyl dehydrogenase [Bacteroidaceae bacterium]|nr:dihydrolipoyl dehydrogenase [Bacteroidaceae bacterium]
MYDIAIIGGGPGGYVAAEKAGKKGLKTILFEKKDLGGVCLNEGCIPTKTLLYSAKLYDYARKSEKYGVRVEEATLDYKKMTDRKTKVMRKLVAGIGLRMKNAGVEVVKAEATISGRTDCGAICIIANGETYEAKNLLLCTGSETFVPPIPGLDMATNEAIVTNRELLALKEAPTSLVIIGGGVIGMEFASLYNSIGAEVHVVEMMPEILGVMDHEISAMLRSQYTKKGIHFHLSCKVTHIERHSVTFTDVEGAEYTIEGDKILLSVGRRPITRGLGLETLDIELERGGVKVDSQMRTNAEGVYAAGDITGYSLLAHTASREAEVAINTICGIEDTMRYDAIPGIVYTNPEVAGTGLTEAQAQQQGIEYECRKLPMAYSGRFVAENEGGEGLCKVITDKASDRVLGVHMIGNPCSEIISSACIAIERGMTAGELERVVFPHPTVAEIVKECLI